MKKTIKLNGYVSRCARVKKLREQQKELIRGARGGRKTQIERIQKQYIKQLERMILYKSKKSHRKALQTGKLRKRKIKIRK